MKNNKSWISLVEAMVLVLILSVWLIWIFSFFSKSRVFLDWVSTKIEAIEIAREAIEAFENIRNTNWIRFPWNTDFCWNVLNYDWSCVLDTKTSMSSPKITSNSTYILYNDNWIWKIEARQVDWLSYSSSEYRNRFFVWKNESTWKYCQIPQSWDNECKKILFNYTRRIDVKNITKDKMEIKVTVEWKDQSSSAPRKVEIVNLLTNYK